jgi:hypothetical protein
MNACSLLRFDLGSCLGGMLFWWVPLVPWWAWLLVALIVVGIVWKVAGWPGLIALAAGAGFFLGRRSVTDDDIWPNTDPKPQKLPKAKVRRPARKRRFNPDTGGWEEV